MSEYPEILSFTDFLRWNYTLDYGRFLRGLHDRESAGSIENVVIEQGVYDRVHQMVFTAHVICRVFYDDGQSRQYCVEGYYRANGKSDFFCSAHPYHGEEIPRQQPLDEYLVPILRRENFESVAEEMLEKFYPCPKDTVIDGMLLARMMGYKVRRVKLQGEKAKIIFGDSILVDETTGDNGAILHECVHGYLHCLFYDLQSRYRLMANRDRPEFSCYFYSPEQNRCVHWMEVQAAAITRRLQMPRQETARMVTAFFDQLGREPGWSDYRYAVDMVRERYRVPRNAAKQRLCQLGWRGARGVYVYNVNRYVDDHDIDSRLPDNYTYTISMDQLLKVYPQLLESDSFTYADGHVVLNQPRYTDGQKLTVYARHHMAECCVGFLRVYGKYGYSYTFGELSKAPLREICPESRELTAEQSQELRRAVEEITAESVKLEQTPSVNPLSAAVKFHMKRCAVTEDVVADRSGMGVDTVSKLRRGGGVKLETVLAFCVALELEEPFRVDLMKKAGVAFDTSNPAHRIYMAILDAMPGATVFQINQFLRESGYAPWTREKSDAKRHRK